MRSPAWLAAVLLLLAACGHGVPAAHLLARQCLAVGAGHEAGVSFQAPASGLLQVTLEERGITTVAALDDDPARGAASPLARFGTIVLAARTAAAGHHSLQVRAADSPAIRGTVCVTAQVIPESSLLGRAAQDLAAAGRATLREDWSTAFSRYLAAARRLERSGARQAAASARQALAELAYRRLDRKRDAYALAGMALDEDGTAAAPVLRGLLAGLEAKALLDMPGVSLPAVAPAIRARLAAARRLMQLSPDGARELPRVAILEGFLDYRTDQRDAARRLWTGASQDCKALRDWDCYAIAVQNNAQLAKENKSYAFALASFEEALRLLPPAQDPKLIANIWNNQGRLQAEVGLFSLAERSHEAALRAYLKLHDCEGVRQTLAFAGGLLVQVGTLADAETDLADATSLDCPRLLAAASGTLPTVPSAATGAERLPAAPEDPCAHALDPEELTTESKNDLFNSLLALSDVRMLRSLPRQAGPCLAAAQRYATTSRTRMRLANAQGNMLLERGDAARARAAFTAALRIADAARLPPSYEHRGLAELGLVRSALLAGDSVSALGRARRALESSLARGDIDQTVTSLRLIAASDRATGRVRQSERTLEVAADLIEAVPIDELDGEQRATYLSTQHGAFAELTDLLASQAAADPRVAWAAFAASERGRARSLRFAASQTTHDTAHATPSTARYQQLLQEVVRLPARTGVPRSQVELLEEIDRAAQRERDPAQALTQPQLDATLRELDASLIEYAVGNRDLFAFVVNPGATTVIRLGDAREVEAAATTLLDRARDLEPAPRDVQSAARALAQQILWPLTGLVRGRRILFVPDDALHTVPFGLLPWSAATPETLVHHMESAIVPSATFLTLRASLATRSARPRIELIGDPVFRISDWARECTADRDGGQPERTARGLADWTQSLPRLRGSRREITMIARLARQSRPGTSVQTFLGCAAVPDALRRAASEDPQLLHIATHARIDAERPRLSALALSPDPARPDTPATFGLLDILGLKLKAQLVVLSACDTSRGRLLPGEGVLGPAQAFLQAGARSVIASYWRVDDELTATFMQHLYTHLLLEHMTASAALRSAQLDAARASASLDWAAFALYGWPDSTL